jgi:tRNA(Arg) A34 adenosine deaminase TadA
MYEYLHRYTAETVMYTSTEPCPMCAGGMATAEFGRIVYSVEAAMNAGCSGLAIGRIDSDTESIPSIDRFLSFFTFEHFCVA